MSLRPGCRAGSTLHQKEEKSHLSHLRLSSHHNHPYKTVAAEKLTRVSVLDSARLGILERGRNVT